MRGSAVSRLDVLADAPAGDRARDELLPVPQLVHEGREEQFPFPAPALSGIRGHFVGQPGELVELQDQEGGEVGRLDDPVEVEHRRVVPSAVVAVLVERQGRAGAAAMIEPVAGPGREPAVDLEEHLGGTGPGRRRRSSDHIQPWIGGLTKL